MSRLSASSTRWMSLAALLFAAGSSAPSREGERTRALPEGRRELHRSRLESAREWTVHAADLERDGTWELFAAPVEGGTPVVLVAPDEDGAVGESCAIDADGRFVVYACANEGRGPRLYSTRVAGGAAVGLSRPGAAIQDFRIGADGRQVVYRSPDEARGILELHTVPIDGGLAPVKLSEGGDVQDYAISPDGAWVVFLVDAGSHGRSELFSAPTDASRPPIELGARPSGGVDVASGFRIDPGSRRVVYKAAPEREERFRLFEAALDGTSPASELSAPLPPHGHVGWFEIAPDGASVVYQAFHGGDFPELVSDLWQVTLAPERARELLVEATRARRLRIEPDGRALVYEDRHAERRRVALGRGALDSAASVPLGGAPPLGPATSAGSPASAASAGSVGYRDFSFGTTGSSTPTGEKPECKLWWNDGSWWGDLYDDAAQVHRIGRLDLASQTWVNTGTTLDERSSSKSDVLWDAASRKLYVASHVFTTNAQPTPSNWGRLFRYSYSAASRTYALDPGFPVDITRGNAEALTIAKDSLGRLWATWVEASRVMINHSVSADLDWGTPAVLPASASATSLTSDDISAVIAFGGNRVGVMWSNQLTATTYFAARRDADPLALWQPEEAVIPGAGCSGLCSDDLFNLKSDALGRVLVALKTSHTDSDSALILVAVRGGGGGWTTTPFGLVRDHHTRPVLLLDQQNERVYVFATSPESGGAIYFKSAPTSALQFEPGLGTPFLLNATDITINNATSTKQNLDNQTDLLVLASDQNTRFYLHNFLDLGPAGNPPSIGSFTPTSGPVGTQVTIDGSGFAGTTAVRFNGAQASFTVVSAAQIRATVPGGATTGRIGVTTPGGSATSGADFVVTVPPAPPSIGSFTPTSGPVGTQVIVDGSHFNGASSVRFNGVQASFTVLSASQIRTFVPGGATTGHIGVTTPGGSATSSTDFVVTLPPAPPSIGSFTPTGGPVGTQVTVNGSHFTGTTSVRFNGTQASFSILSSSQIRATVPGGATTGRIRVSTPIGTATSSASFTVTQPPVIHSFTPAIGFLGTPVTLTGSRFSGATSVKFNGKSALVFVVLGDTSILAVVPLGATSGRISVTTDSGTGVSSSSFTVL